MKILDILSENFDLDMGTDTKTFVAPKISLSDLNSLQLRTLERLQSRVIDMDTASDKELDIIMDLIDMGLVDADGNVTASGDEASDDPTTNVKLSADDADVEDIDLDDLEDFDDESDSDEIDFTLSNRSIDY